MGTSQANERERLNRECRSVLGRILWRMAHDTADTELSGLSALPTSLQHTSYREGNAHSFKLGSCKSVRLTQPISCSTLLTHQCLKGGKKTTLCSDPSPDPRSSGGSGMHESHRRSERERVNNMATICMLEQEGGQAARCV